MSSKEFNNMYKGIIFIAVGTILVVFGLNRVAYSTGAGTAAFQISLMFVMAQAAVVALVYVHWYRMVNRLVAEMYNIEEKRRTAFRYIGRYLAFAILITVLIAVAAIVAMFLNVLFVGINHAFCYTSVFIEFFVGNITLWILMRFFGLPDRVINKY